MPLCERGGGGTCSEATAVYAERRARSLACESSALVAAERLDGGSGMTGSAACASAGDGGGRLRCSCEGAGCTRGIDVLSADAIKLARSALTLELGGAGSERVGPLGGVGSG